MPAAPWKAIELFGDQDWYRMRLQEVPILPLHAEQRWANPLSDPLLRLHNAGEEVAVDDDGGEGFNSYLEFTAPSTGNYFLGAGAFGDASTGGYTLTARAGDIPADATTDASLAPDGDYREGILAPAGDRDWYRAELVEGQGMRVGLTGTGTPDTLGDPYLVLYGPDGAEILRDDDGGDGLNAWLDIPRREGRRTTSSKRAASPMTLRAVTRSTSPVANRRLGRDGASTSRRTAKGRVSMIGTPDDTDWYSIELVEGRPYRFYVDGIDDGDRARRSPAHDLRLAGRSSCGDDDGGRAQLVSHASHRRPAAVLCRRVVLQRRQSTGRYSCAPSTPTCRATLTRTKSLEAAGDDRISRIEISGRHRCLPRRTGGWRAPTSIERSTAIGDDPLGDAFLTIADGEGTRVTSDDDSGNGMDARLRFTPEAAGTYYIQASGLGGSTGWYQVSIMRQ